MIINPYFYPSGPTDPDFASVISLLHFNGSDNGTTFTDVTGRTWTPTNAVTHSEQKVYGTASGKFVAASSAKIETAHHADWAFGSGAFAIEFRIRFPNVTGTQAILMKPSVSLYAPFFILRNGTDVSFYSSSDGANWDIASALSFGTVAADTWYAMEVNRSGTTFTTLKDGTVANTTTSSATLYNDITADVYIGARGGDLYLDAYIDEFRASKGVSRDTSNYTPAAAEFPNF